MAAKLMAMRAADSKAAGAAATAAAGGQGSEGSSCHGGMTGGQGEEEGEEAPSHGEVVMGNSALMHVIFGFLVVRGQAMRAGGKGEGGRTGTASLMEASEGSGAGAAYAWQDGRLSSRRALGVLSLVCRQWRDLTATDMYWKPIARYDHTTRPAAATRERGREGGEDRRACFLHGEGPCSLTLSIYM